MTISALGRDRVLSEGFGPAPAGLAECGMTGSLLGVASRAPFSPLEGDVSARAVGEARSRAAWSSMAVSLSS